jgi:hypothetical protein
MTATIANLTTPALTVALPLDSADFSALWTGVTLNPADKAPVLIAADWLEERGYDALSLAVRALAGVIKVGLNSITIETGKLFIIRGRNSKGKIVKPLHYYFSKLNEAVQFVARHAAAHAAKVESKATARREIARQKEEWTNPYTVGTLLYDCWGYDETHYDFAQIVAVGPRSVTIRRICPVHVEGGYGGEVIQPVAGNFYGESTYDRRDGSPKTVAVKFGMGNEGKMAWCLPGWTEVSGRERFVSTAGTR